MGWIPHAPGPTFGDVGVNVWSVFLSVLFYRRSFSQMVMVMTVVTTLFSFVKPTANAYALNFFALHIAYSLLVELKE